MASRRRVSRRIPVLIVAVAACTSHGHFVPDPSISQVSERTYVFLETPRVLAVGDTATATLAECSGGYDWAHCIGLGAEVALTSSDTTILAIEATAPLVATSADSEIRVGGAARHLRARRPGRVWLIARYVTLSVADSITIVPRAR